MSGILTPQDIVNISQDILDVEEWANGDSTHVQTFRLGEMVPSPANVAFGTNLVNWTGQWLGVTNYNPLDAVTDGGSSYIALSANVGDQPPSINWQIMAQAGDGSKEFNTVADLVADTTIVLGQIVKTNGYTTLGDDGDNSYLVVPAGTGVDDGGSFIDLVGIPEQVQALFPGGKITFEQFGATADGVTDDLAEQLACADFVGNTGGGAIFAKAATYAQTDTFTVDKNNVTVFGQGRAMTGSNNSIDLSGATIFKRIGAGTTPMVVWEGGTGAVATTKGGGMKGVHLDCRDKAIIGLYVKGTHTQNFGSISVEAATEKHVFLEAQFFERNNTAENAVIAVSMRDFVLNTSDNSPNAEPLVLDGNSWSDVNRCRFEQFYINYENGTGVVCGACDANNFDGIYELTSSSCDITVVTGTPLTTDTVLTGGTSGATATFKSLTDNGGGSWSLTYTRTGGSGNQSQFIHGETVTLTGSGATGTIDAASLLGNGIGWTWKSGGTLLTLSAVSGTFTQGETITGGTSGETATVDFDRNGVLQVSSPSGAFTITETITGGTSGETGTLDKEQSGSNHARKNSVFKVQTNPGGMLAEGTVQGAAPSEDNTVYAYSSGNASPDPKVNFGGSLTWHSQNGDTYLGAVQVVDFSDDLMLNFTNPGDLAVVYSTKIGRGLLKDGYFEFEIDIVASSFTYTTATGNFEIQGLPYVCDDVNQGGVLCHHSGGTNYPAGSTSIVPRVRSGNNTMRFIGMGSGSAAANTTTAQIISGSTQAYTLTGRYRVATS